jgi:hypothetical protein
MEHSKDPKPDLNKMYLEENIQVLMKPLIADILKNKPKNVLQYMAKWCNDHSSQPYPTRNPLTDKKGVTNKQRIPKKVFNEGNDYNPAKRLSLSSKPPRSPDTPETSPDEDGNIQDEEKAEEEWFAKKRASHMKKKMGISAEVYTPGNFKDFKPRIVAKTALQEENIRKILSNNFMFNGLDEKDQKIVINAMEIKEYNPDDFVIRQGEDGNELFIVESGLLKCTLRPPKMTNDIFIKNYEAGGLFGELALMYNVPRSASITAIEKSKLLALDRETFNNIVKVSVIKQRE